jgi:transposase
MSIVAVPSPEQEQRRSVVRHREQLVRMGSQLKRWQEEALAADAKECQVRRELDKMVSIIEIL